MTTVYKVEVLQEDNVTWYTQYHVSDDKVAALRYWFNLFPGSKSIQISKLGEEGPKQFMLPGI